MLSDQHQPTLCIVVLNWNKPQATLACLNSLLPDVQQLNATLVVVDNASTDSSTAVILEWAQQRFQCNTTKLSFQQLLFSPTASHDFMLLQSGCNRGYAGGNNIALRYALASKQYDYILILNNDTVVQPGSLQALIDYADTHPDIGILGSTLVDQQHPERVLCAGGCRYHPLTTLYKASHHLKPLDECIRESDEIKLDYVSGAAALFRRSILEEFGLFDEAFFLYYEELDYAQRLKNSGYQLGWCPHSIIWHDNTKTPTDIRQYHENLSTLKFTAKHHPRLLPIAAIFRLLGKLLWLTIQGRPQQFIQVLRAYNDFFLQKNLNSTQNLDDDIKVAFLGTLKK